MVDHHKENTLWSAAQLAHLVVAFLWFFSAVRVNLPQQVLDAPVVELVTSVAVLIQPTHLAHQEVRDLEGAASRHSLYEIPVNSVFARHQNKPIMRTRSWFLWSF